MPDIQLGGPGSGRYPYGSHNSEKIEYKSGHDKSMIKEMQDLKDKFVAKVNNTEKQFEKMKENAPEANRDKINSMLSGFRDEFSKTIEILNLKDEMKLSFYKSSLEQAIETGKTPQEDLKNLRQVYGTLKAGNEFSEIGLTESELKQLIEQGHNRIQLGEQGNWSWNEVLFEGIWPNSATGKDITVVEKTIDNIIKNFYDNVRGQSYKDTQKPTVPWDYGHESNKEGAGWVAEIEKRDKELPTGKKVKSMWVKNYSWTPKAQDGVKNGVWLFSSVDFNDFYNSVTGKTYKDVLFGIALTNRPAVKYCASVRLSEPDDAPPGDEGEHKEGGIHMPLLKLRAVLVGQGVNLAEGVADDTIEYAAVEKIRGQSEIITLNEKKLTEVTEAKNKAEKELGESKASLAKVEAEKKALAEAEKTKKKIELEEAAKIAYTPAQLTEGKTAFQAAMKSDNFELAESILAEKGVAFKETRKDEGQADEDEDEAEMAEGKDWDSQSSPYKEKKMAAWVKDKKMDEEEKGVWNKADAACAKEHNAKMGKKAGGKK
jgi:hypothetical protein